ITKLLGDDSSEIRKAALSLVKRQAKIDQSALYSHLIAILPNVIQALNDPNLIVKLKAERTILYCLELNSGKMDAAIQYLKADGNKLRTKITDLVLRRISRLPEYSDESDSSDVEN
ncbi:eIF-2-alpha kinase activator GCN1, partial [Cymbomonas tetramitiformis]